MQRPPEQPPDYAAIKRLLVKGLKELAYMAVLVAIGLYFVNHIWIPSGYFERVGEKARAEISPLIDGVHVPGTERPLAELFSFWLGRSSTFLGPASRNATRPTSEPWESVYTKEELLVHFEKELDATGWSEECRKRQGIDDVSFGAKEDMSLCSISRMPGQKA